MKNTDIVDLVEEHDVSAEDLARALFNYMSGDELEEFVDFLSDELELGLGDDEDED